MNFEIREKFTGSRVLFSGIFNFAQKLFCCGGAWRFELSKGSESFYVAPGTDMGLFIIKVCFCFVCYQFWLHTIDKKGLTFGKSFYFLQISMRNRKRTTCQRQNRSFPICLGKDDFRFSLPNLGLAYCFITKAVNRQRDVFAVFCQRLKRKN